MPGGDTKYTWNWSRKDVNAFWIVHLYVSRRCMKEIAVFSTALQVGLQVMKKQEGEGCKRQGTER